MHYKRQRERRIGKRQRGREENKGENGRREEAEWQKGANIKSKKSACVSILIYDDRLAGRP